MGVSRPMNPQQHTNVDVIRAAAAVKQSGEVPWNRCRVMIVGQSNVGKTRLRKVMGREEYKDSDLTSTDGVRNGCVSPDESTTAHECGCDSCCCCSQTIWRGALESM